MAVIINASTSTGLVQSADTSGIIQFQSNGSTKATLNSSGFSYPGAVIQVVQAVYGTSTTVSSTSYTDSGITASITPTSSSNKILILLNPIVRVYRGTNFTILGSMIIVRGSTKIHQTDTPELTIGSGSSGYHIVGAGHSLIYLDSPATTSSTTYKMQMKVNSTTNDGAINLNNFITADGDSKSTITLMEIAA